MVLSVSLLFLSQGVLNLKFHLLESDLPYTILMPKETRHSEMANLAAIVVVAVTVGEVVEVVVQ